MTPWILSRLMSLFTVFLRFLNCSRLPDFLALSREAMVARVSRLRLIFGLSGLNLMAFNGATVSSASFTNLMSIATATFGSLVLYKGDQSLFCKASSRSDTLSLEMSLL